ncbi:hypothetical protein LSS_22845 [Leptospira santarosai serovar Shermani str. LT 821]|uniref:Uncharacterized protein n=1 Tax=Leptospira santarosai serovar Shermani str. LT 821 TaxID=758847 RepID=A0A097ESX5_9LEPT|nr:hypothetical protein LSS_22845 [Leptospira santarosai serovar Shermani str. LT 821]
MKSIQPAVAYAIGRFFYPKKIVGVPTNYISLQYVPKLTCRALL